MQRGLVPRPSEPTDGPTAEEAAARLTLRDLSPALVDEREEE